MTAAGKTSNVEECPGLGHQDPTATSRDVTIPVTFVTPLSSIDIGIA